MRRLNTGTKGFTLIELVVAMAIIIIVFTMVFSVIGRLYSMRVAYDQEMILQQNFRFAIDKIAQEFRQATKGSDYNGEIFLKPDSNSAGETLEFTIFDASLNKTCKVVYSLKKNGMTSSVNRKVYYYDGSSWEEYGPEQSITEQMRQLVKMYFVKRGGKVIVIMVGTVEYFGKKSMFSYTSLFYSRNMPGEGQ